MHSDLFGTARPGRAGGPSGAGVGARQGDPRPPAQGGGSPPSCSVSGDGLQAAPTSAPAPAARDPRIDELRHMGLGVVWVKVAEAIGYEAFLTVWRTLSLNRDFMDKRNRVSIPDIGMLFHYQRNLAIRELAARGYVPRQIQQLMLERTGEKLSIFQVEHAMRTAER